MRRASKPAAKAVARAGAALLLGAVCAVAAPKPAPAACTKPVYLTLDTGHMGVAQGMGEAMRRHGVRATFFVANEPAQEGGSSLGDAWAPWWRQMAADGHDFASHTFDHVYWREDVTLPGGQAGFAVRPSAGAQKGQTVHWSGAQYCAELRRAAERIGRLSGRAALPLFRAPGGKTSPRLIEVARGCGMAHVGWAPAGFLGDELPSDRHPNAQLLQRALASIRPGDILMAHLGIWSRQDPWAPAVFEPLINGLQERGFCFALLRDHPQYRGWIAQRAPG